MKNFSLFILLGLTFACQNKEIKIPTSWDQPYQTISQLGDTLFTPKNASLKLKEQYLEKKKAFHNNPDSLELLIWYGRFEAYLGNYRNAIDIYTYGLQKFTNNAQLLRHRGHRYITLREFDKAITDLEKAVTLIQNQENTIEEDGLPNAQNIPVSTLHGNIYYHLGLAYYFNRNLPKALEAFKSCLNTSNNADNLVSAIHWIYMIQNRLGRKEAGDNYLRNINTSMTVIENTTYHQACLFYKGEIALEDLYPFPTEKNASNTALKYAIGNWFWYNGNPQKAKEIYNEILKGNDWASFGYIAAETDLAKPYVSR